ncbi:patatin-like phospholipase family protein [soil metagenome]
MNISDPTHNALVLGGGGAAGNAWLIGMIAGLAEGGLDVADTDLTVGTSAGSTVAAQISGDTAVELFAGILDSTPQQRSGGGALRPPRTLLDTTNDIIADAENAADMRRRMGAWAIEISDAAGPDASSRWRSVAENRFDTRRWPDRRLLITAVDAETGEPVVFDRDSGVDLVDAVAASTAGGFAYGIGDRRFIDGGYRTNADNADLASGYARVLVLSPFGGRTRLPLEWGLDLATQVARLRADGGAVETVFPDAASRDAFGDDMMNLSARPPAARAGFEQGRGIAEQLGVFWN